MSIQERYWRFLVQLKADAEYYSIYAADAEFWDNSGSVLAALVATGGAATIALSKEFPIAWAVVVALSQVFAVVKQYWPLKKRAISMRGLSYDLSEIYLDAESDWHAVAEGLIDDAETNRRMSNAKAKQLKADKRWIGGLSLSTSGRVAEKRDKVVAAYFRQSFNAVVSIET